MNGESIGTDRPHAMQVTIAQTSSQLPVLDKEVLVLLSKLQIGHELEGKIVILDGKPVLELNNGIKLAVQLEKDTPLEEQLLFKVLGKEKQHLLVEVQSREAEANHTSEDWVQRTVNALGLKEGADTRKLVEQFVLKQLPLTRDVLLPLSYLMKQYPIPLEVMTNLVSSGKLPSTKELEVLTSLKDSLPAQMGGTLEKVLEQLSSSQNIDVGMKLFGMLSQEQMRQVLKQMPESLEKVTQELLSQEALGEKDRLLGGEDFQENLLNEKPKEVFLSKQENFSLKEQWLEHLEPQMLRRFNRLMIEEGLSVSLEQLKEGKSNQLSKMVEVTEWIRKATDIIEETLTKHGGGSEEGASLDQVKLQLATLDKWNMEGQYFYFPLQLKEERAMGELYFFKPKAPKKQSGIGMYIVLALDMPALKKVEVHVKEQTSKWRITLKVENMKIKEQFEVVLQDWMKLLNPDKVMIESIQIDLLTDMKETMQENGEIIRSLNHMDFKV